MIDWNGKLEAVHEDGRVVPVEFDEFYHDGDARVHDAFGCNAFDRETGRHSFGEPVFIRNVKEEATMETKFKVGDRVRKIDEPDVCGVVTSVDDRHGHGVEYARINGDEYGFTHDRWEYDNTPDELADLRAKWADAVARYPDLEPKPETDEEAAARFEDEWWKGAHNSMMEALTAAIAWARANPR